jgi:hypothetical protein
MTENDLIVAAPWILFGAALATVCILLIRARCGGPGSHPPLRHHERHRDGPRPIRSCRKDR